METGIDAANDEIDTHEASTGADHSYIDQSVTTTSSPTFADITVDSVSSSAADGAHYIDITNGVSISTAATTSGLLAEYGDKIYMSDGTDWDKYLLTSESTEAEIEAITGALFGTSKAVTGGYIWVADGTDYEAVTMSGDVALASGGATTIQADSVALTTDTTGNYVSSATANQGLLLTGTEGASLGLIACTDGQGIINSSGTSWACGSVGGTETNSLETVATGIATTEIPIGTAADTVVYAPLSGDVTMTNGGVVTIADDAVTAAKIDETADVTVASLTTTGSAGIDMNNLPITEAKTVTFNSEVDNGSKTASFSVDFSTAQKQKVTLTSNTITLTLDTTSIGVGNHLLKIVNGALATLTWAAETGAVYFPGGTDPTLTTSGTDVVFFYFDGTNFYGSAIYNFL
jgi:hypothetical protein